MPLDPYQLCPCGSGKKLKFCCAAMTEVMEKVQSAQEKGNVRQAQQLIEKQYDPENPVAWACIAHSSMLIEQGKVDLARQVLQTLLKQNSEHPAGIGLYAMTAALSGKFQESKSVIYNVFQSGSGLLPDLASEVASAVSANFARQQCWMGARAYLVLAMRLAPKEAKQDCFYELMSFDANYAIPYPFRSGQPLLNFQGDDAESKEDRKAHKLADLGCYAPAARIYVKLIENHSEDALLYHNAGLCHAWDGNEAQAAHYFHKAAELTEDMGQAVELETLSQLLAWNCVEDKIVPESAHYDVDSISRLLTVLADAGQIQRITNQQNSQIEEWAEAGFEVLDRPRLEAGVTDLKPDDIPEVLGEIFILKETPDAESDKRVIISSDSHDRLEETIKIVQQATDDVKLENESRNESMTELTQPPGVPKEHQVYYWRWGFPTKFAAKPRMELFLEKWEDLVYEKWPKTPQSVLDGQTPAELEPNSVRKYAAAHVLDALSGQRQLPFDLPRIMETLELDPLPQIKPDDEHTLSSLTAMQFNRLDYSDLSDDEMLNVMNRALLTHYSLVLDAILEELLESRPGCEGKFDRFRAYRTLSQIAIFNNNEERALAWVEKALAEATKLEKSFEPVFEWKLRKLTVLLRDPQRPEVKELVTSMHQYYGSKIPEFRNMLAGLQADLNLDVGILAPNGAAVDASSEQGLWSPDQPEASGDKKLWLPGQE
ncbi:SEC-C metal-binding domain-containing protein [Polystyrenella longa]|nr:SEC-C metal-binding domain-containing protein [Polystyrenella longa]